MRVKVEGRVNRERLFNIAEEIMRTIEKYGIKEMRGLNLYFVPLHPETGEEAGLITPNGDEMGGFILKDPNKKLTKKKPAKILSLVKNERAELQQNG